MTRQKKTVPVGAETVSISEKMRYQSIYIISSFPRNVKRFDVVKTLRKDDIYE